MSPTFVVNGDQRDIPTDYKTEYLWMGHWTSWDPSDAEISDTAGLSIWVHGQWIFLKVLSKHAIFAFECWLSMQVIWSELR